MTRRCVRDLQPGEILEEGIFLVRERDLRRTTQGSLYIHAVLADRTGEIVARMWQATETMYSAMPEGCVVAIRGRVETYKNQRQVIIEALRPIPPEDVDYSAFLPATQRDVDEMFERVKAILRGLRDPDLLRLVGAFIRDEDLMARFRQAPAAKEHHHAYLGGLLEHTLNVLEVACLVLPRYPELNADLVLAGIFFHDIGKAAELTWESGFNYSDEGQLLGHIAIGLLWIHEKARQVEQETGRAFPAELLHTLEHIVLSHHGLPEFGSPKIPAVPEAVAVHYLDNLDAKIYQYLHSIAADPDEASRWTPYNRALSTRVFKGSVAAE